ncbi:MAG: hypothetical protein WD668_11345, partial [Saccharospirillum sp.]
VSVKYWTSAVPSDTELRSASLRHCLWIGVFAYAFYTLMLEVTAPPSPGAEKSPAQTPMSSRAPAR